LERYSSIIFNNKTFIFCVQNYAHENEFYIHQIGTTKTVTSINRNEITKNKASVYFYGFFFWEKMPKDSSHSSSAAGFT
jgi:hypothetical protein